jgi:hypothetical protein
VESFGMASRKRKPWSADLPPLPWAEGGKPHVPAPLPPRETVVGLTTGHLMPLAERECLRCEQIREGYTPTAPEHSPACSYQGAGRDPERGG